MRKNYVYQNKGQYKLLQNASRIGGFYAGDQGVIPSERVLPEQRFAHQPIFRRPPEELVTVFSYIHKFNQGVFSTTDHTIKAANLFKKSSTTAPDGVHLLYKYIGWTDAPYVQNILLKNWSAEALATKYWGGSGIGWLPISGLGYEGTTLKSDNFPVFFKDYVFFRASAYTDAIYYAKLNPKKTETKEIKVALLASGEEFFVLGWLYVDNTDSDYGYKIVAYRTTNFNESENFMQYKAVSLEGPWVYDKTWDTYTAGWIGDYGSPAYIAIIQEMASLILSKTHKELSMAVFYSSPGWAWVYNDIRTEVYRPPSPYNLGTYAFVYGRGNEGEIVQIWQPSANNYLIKRLGNGQMKKTLVTDIDNGYFD